MPPEMQNIFFKSESKIMKSDAWTRRRRARHRRTPHRPPDRHFTGKTRKLGLYATPWLPTVRDES